MGSYHLLLETPEANLSRAMHWINVAYSIWFYTERPLRQGLLERPWDRLVAGLVLGSEAFAKELRQGLRGNPREQPAPRALAGRLSWERIVTALESRGRLGPNSLPRPY